MTLAAHLDRLAAGVRPEDDGLLGNCRCEWRGVEMLGEEAILASFSRQPFAAGEAALRVDRPGSAAWIGSDAALFADVYGGRIGRLWRLGEGDAGECERAVSVAFDPDLSQVRGDIAFRKEDHPELEPSGMGAIRQAAAAALEPLRAGGALRVRGFVIRALGDDRAAAALIAVYVLWDDTPRAMQSGYAAVGVAPGRAPLAVFDLPPPSAWAPRL